MRQILVLIILLALASPAAAFFNTQTGQAAVIQLDGAITPSSSSSLTSTGGINPGKVRELKQKALSRNPDAVIIEWNSGGGAVVASKDIKRIIDDIEKPTVCRFRDVAASGAFIASLGCDRIVADSATITGSIGVRSSYLEYSGLLDKLGVEYVNISSGNLKEIGSPFQNITDRERQVLEEKNRVVRDQIVGMVETERNLSENQLEEVESGSIFLGSEAQDLGLVDSIGGREAALQEAENLSAKEDLKPVMIEESPSFNWLSLLTADINFNLDSSNSVITSSIK